MRGSDQAARTPWVRAISRMSSGHFGSIDTSSMITRCFVKAAVPHEPLLGPTANGVMAAAKGGAIRGAALGQSCFPFASIRQTNEEAPEEQASMVEHSSFRTS